MLWLLQEADRQSTIDGQMKIFLLVVILLFCFGCIHMIVPAIMLEAHKIDKAKNIEKRIKNIERSKK